MPSTISRGLEQYTDDELIDFMVRVFNGRAQGSIEYLMGTSLETMCRYAPASDGKSADSFLWDGDRDAVSK